MPIIDLEPSLVDAPVDTPTGFRTTAEYIEPGGGRKFVASIEAGGSGIPVGAEHDFLVGVTSRVTGKSPSDIANRWGVLATDPELVAMSKLRGTPTFSEGAAAIFRHENSFVSQMSAADRTLPLEREEGYNPWEDIKGTRYEKYFDSFADIRNSRAARMRKQQIDQEIDDRRIIDALPWYQSLPMQLLAGVLDPSMAVPGGAFVRGAKGGFSVARSTASVGAGGAASMSVQEAGLHSSQHTRTAAETVVNIGAGTMLAGAVGEAGAFLR